MMKRIFVLLAFSGSLTSTLFAGTERGSDLVGEAGGVAGVAGLPGAPGVPGAPGILEFSDFYSLNNPGPIALGSAVPFSIDGPANAPIPIIVRTGASTFLIPAVGTYLVQFQVNTSNAGQLQLRLNGAFVANSVVGRATGSTQIVGISLLTTTIPNSILEVVNPPGNPGALTLPANDGGTEAISDHLSIIRIQ